MGIKIYGASDDLIEVEGDVNEEFSFYPDNEKDARLIAVSDGTLLRVNYDADGIWRIVRVMIGEAEYSKIDGNVEQDKNDTVTLSGNIKWVALATKFGKA